jgi:hypothetical protein
MDTEDILLGTKRFMHPKRPGDMFTISRIGQVVSFTMNGRSGSITLADEHTAQEFANTAMRGWVAEGYWQILSAVNFPSGTKLHWVITLRWEDGFEHTAEGVQDDSVTGRALYLDAVAACVAETTKQSDKFVVLCWAVHPE